MSRPNVYADGPWDMEAEKMQIRSLFVGLASGAKELGMSMHELLPGSSGFNLHAHYAIEELFVVLGGRPTLRTPTGEEQLEPGDVVSLPARPRRDAHVRQPDRRAGPRARRSRPCSSRISCSTRRSASSAPRRATRSCRFRKVATRVSWACSICHPDR